jgi:predicted enzyme related to lactoylglutathione lyase
LLRKDAIMSERQAFKLEHVAPVIPVTDLTKALAHYSETLLFGVTFEWTDSDGAPPNYAVVRQGNCERHLTLSRQPQATTAYVFVDGVSALCDAVKANGANITRDIVDQPWEMREFEVADPDGNRLIFGEHLSRIGKSAGH